MSKHFIALVFIVSTLSLLEIADSLTATTHRRPYNPSSNQIGGRIVKGTPVKETKLYQAAISITNTSTGDTFTCGGSIIDAKWILTAAHCLEEVDFATIRVGSLKFSTGGQELNSTTFIIHSQYNLDNSLNNDIALIDLSATPIILNNKFVKVVKLVAKGKSCVTSPKVVVSGWGKTSDQGSTSDILLQTTLTEVSTYDCVTAFTIKSVPSTTICAKGKNGEDSCQGDSGGPLMSGTTQVGIVSFGGETCETGAVGVYTRVGSYLDWIRKKTGISFE